MASVTWVWLEARLAFFFSAAKGDGVRNNGGDGTPRQRMGWDSATTERMGLNNCVLHNGYGYEGDDGEDDE